MFVERIDCTQWDKGQQYLYSLLWSAFLDLDRYTAGRAYKRFRPYSTVWVVRELLSDRSEVRDLHVGGRADFLPPSPALAPAFKKLVLWAVAPNFYGREERDDEQARASGGVDDADLNRLNPFFLEEFRRHFSLELAAFRAEASSRPWLPPLPERRIGATEAALSSDRRHATARLSSAIQIRFDKLQEALGSQALRTSSYWFADFASAGADLANPDHEVDVKVRLPGGRDPAEDAKLRILKTKFAFSADRFGFRVDYDGHEEAKAATTEPVNEAADSDPVGEERLSSYARERVHIAKVEGFVSLEKMPGRPGWTQYTAERSIRFESPNHDRFRVETLMAWHAIDLISLTLVAHPDGQ